MATGIFRNKNLVRPRKHGAAKRRRLLEQKRRLMALGVSEEKIRHLTSEEIRRLLQRPTRLPKEVLRP